MIASPTPLARERGSLLGGLPLLRLAADIWLAGRADEPAILARQHARLARLVTFARTASPLYRELYRGLPTAIADPHQLPPVRKPELMARFDDWVTDPAVTRAGVEEWIADPSRIGQLFLGRYLVYTTSGTTGVPAILLQDRRSLLLYNLFRLRILPSVLDRHVIAEMVEQRARVAGLFVTGGHYGGVALTEWQRQRHPLGRGLRLFSVTTPIPHLVDELNEFQPAFISGYASALVQLAHEQRAGRLHLTPAVIVSTAETLPPVDRALVETAFNCRVWEGYAASEAPTMAFDCRRGRLHVNADWYVVEPVDQDDRPVAVGQPSHTVLVTNLINRVQPIIRYDLGDSITFLPERCACGSALPLIRVEGRTDDVLAFPAAVGPPVRVLPLALGTVIEEAPGVHRFQAIQTAPTTLTIRLDEASGADRDEVWREVSGRLHEYLTRQGSPDVTLALAAERPARGRSGKFRHVWSEGARAGPATALGPREVREA